MIDADFVRIFYNKTSNQFDTEDAFLSKELNCDFVTGGLCADSKVITYVIKLLYINNPCYQLFINHHLKISNISDIINYRFLTTETNSRALYIFHCFLRQPHQ